MGKLRSKGPNPKVQRSKPASKNSLLEDLLPGWTFGPAVLRSSPSVRGLRCGLWPAVVLLLTARQRLDSKSVRRLGEMYVLFGGDVVTL